MQESAAGFLTSARSYCTASVMRHKLNELHGTKENIFFLDIYIYKVKPKENHRQQHVLDSKS